MKSSRVIAVTVLLLLLVVVLAFATGPYPIAPGALLSSMAARLADAGTALSPTAEAVIWQVSGPRVLAGVLVGAALGAAGAAYQSMFRNPLVSPDILGVSAGCGLGASLAILVGLPVVLVSLSAFGGGLLAVALVMLMARRVGDQEPVLVLVLAGVAIGALLGAGVSLVKLLADPAVQLPSITFWLLGGLHGIVPADLVACAPAIGLGALGLFLARWRIDLLTLADDEAASLGVSVARWRGFVVVAATLMTAAAVAVSGVIGWVGLVVPHVARLLVGPAFGRLLPMAMLLGALFIVAADALARSLVTIELPLSVLTAFIGTPFFLWLLGRRQTEAG